MIEKVAGASLDRPIDRCFRLEQRSFRSLHVLGKNLSLSFFE